MRDPIPECFPVVAFYDFCKLVVVLEPRLEDMLIPVELKAMLEVDELWSSGQIRRAAVS